MSDFELDYEAIQKIKQDHQKTQRTEAHVVDGDVVESEVLPED